MVGYAARHNSMYCSLPVHHQDAIVVGTYPKVALSVVHETGNQFSLQPGGLAPVLHHLAVNA